MEKKTTQRIVGIIVALALIIILLPLLYNRSDDNTQVATIKEPPFPDQQNSSSTDLNQQIPVPPEITKNMADVQPGEEKKSPTDVSPAPTISEAQPSEEKKPAADVSPAPTISEAQPSEEKKPAVDVSSAPTISEAQSASSPVKPVESVVSTPTEMTPPVKMDSDKMMTKEEEVKTQSEHPKNSAQLNKKKQTNIKVSSSSSKVQVDDLKKAAWVVQLGSFNDKENARRLADKLRAAGFKAFTQEVKSSHSSKKQTRVYIGPEFKQASAAKLSKQIEKQMNLRGFIVSYKPLEL